MKDLFLPVLVIVILCVASDAQTTREKSVLLKGEEAKRVAEQCSLDSPRDFTDTWEPSAEDIRKMEAKMQQISQLRAKCCIEGASIENPSEWYMQYAALKWRGKKIIYISAISITEPEKGPCSDKDGIITDEQCDFWKHHAVVICDGGNTWGVIYDIETGKFSDLSVNGIA